MARGHKNTAVNATVVGSIATQKNKAKRGVEFCNAMSREFSGKWETVEVP